MVKVKVENLRDNCLVSEIVPTFFNARVALDFGRPIHSLPNAQSIILGSGVDENYENAIEKAVSELIERLTMTIGALVYDKVKLTGYSLLHKKKKTFTVSDIYCEWMADKANKRPRTSTGVSCHINKKAAIKHALLELLERDQTGLCWRLTDWPIATIPLRLCQSSCLRVIRDAGYEWRGWECSLIADLPVVIVALVDYENLVTFGTAAGSISSAILKATGEALVLSRTNRLIRDMRLEGPLTGSINRVVSTSKNWSSIIDYFENKPTKPITNGFGAVSRHLLNVRHLRDVWVVNADPLGKIAPSGRKVVKLVTNELLDSNHNEDDFISIINSGGFADFACQMFGHMHCIDRKIHQELLPFG
jgi:hypothetical protein